MNQEEWERLRKFDRRCMLLLSYIPGLMFFGVGIVVGALITPNEHSTAFVVTGTCVAAVGVISYIVVDVLQRRGLKARLSPDSSPTNTEE